MVTMHVWLELKLPDDMLSLCLGPSVCMDVCMCMCACFLWLELKLPDDMLSLCLGPSICMHVCMYVCVGRAVRLHVNLVPWPICMCVCVWCMKKGVWQGVRADDV
jgi:hypothetical protein